MIQIILSGCNDSSQTFTSALYQLAAHPEYAEPLRKEVESVIEKEGWTKIAMVQMRLLDSFLKESARLNGTNACACYCLL